MDEQRPWLFQGQWSDVHQLFHLVACQHDFAGGRLDRHPTRAMAAARRFDEAIPSMATLATLVTHDTFTYRGHGGVAGLAYGRLSR